MGAVFAELGPGFGGMGEGGIYCCVALHFQDDILGEGGFTRCGAFIGALSLSFLVFDGLEYLVASFRLDCTTRRRMHDCAGDCNGLAKKTISPLSYMPVWKGGGAVPCPCT